MFVLKFGNLPTMSALPLIQAHGFASQSLNWFAIIVSSGNERVYNPAN